MREKEQHIALGCVKLNYFPSRGLSREKVTNYFLLSIFLTGYFNRSFNLPFNRLFKCPLFSRESPQKFVFMVEVPLAVLF